MNFGRWTVIEVLGEGGQGCTYQARDQSGQEAALKVFEAGVASQNEAELLRTLDHPQIPAFIDTFTVDDTTCIAMEYIEGDSLQAILDQRRHIPEADVLRVARGLLEIAEYLHKLDPPVTHRDIKPANVILRPNGTIALVDLGGGLRADQDGEVLGTTGYAAPEQYFGDSNPAIDLYGIGATLLHLTSRRHPAEFPMRRLRFELENNLVAGDRLFALIKSLTEPDPAHRPATAREALAILDQVAGPEDDEIDLDRDTDRLLIRSHRRATRIERFSAIFLGVFIPLALASAAALNMPHTLVVLIAMTGIGSIASLIWSLPFEQLELDGHGWRYQAQLFGRVWRTATGGYTPGLGLRTHGDSMALYDYTGRLVPHMCRKVASRKREKIANAVHAWIAEHTNETVLFATANDEQPDEDHAAQQRVEVAVSQR